MIFRDRKDAGERLAAVLSEKNFARTLVLGIPRGGVPVAAEVARRLGAELGVLVARKLGAPGNPELAIGAVTAHGVAYINSAIAFTTGADDTYIAAETERQAREARRREELFDGHRRPVAKGRAVIVVDDGIATGATAIAALRALKAEGATSITLAVPVGPPEMLELLRGEADEVVYLESDPGFGAVGQYYIDFDPVSDDEVRATLEMFSVRTGAPPVRQVEVKRDGLRLIGALMTPAGRGPFPLVIFVHGLGSSKESPRNLAIAHDLVEAGIAALLFDLSGHGASSPDPRGGLDAYVSDLEAFSEWSQVQEEVRSDAIGVAGSSMGAAVVAAALARGSLKPVTAVLRAPAMEQQDFPKISVPSLVLVGTLDPMFDEVRGIVSQCPNLTISIVAGAGHLFEESGTLDEARRRTVVWFSARLLPGANATSPGGG